ncbi:ABC transporter permease [Mesorhizobium sp. M1C.F.Ca.ET.193.01.1.1]|uniref:ABC transporter permease n=1 Tax=unclassified Mesorhizobium TaxID=325217 RepID=UPI000FD1D598|nr:MULTISPECIES: ABC transporter permease [unclassified Mesorhizobium]TGT02277.1 ABC transporter permease [bacterium M00.F.Ca.ET.177.01.1.1]TGQ54528.1 ABC transporter permease [Mesorhizobium sp. M1C.F.Ca.ET.210.01.1.1]TGQ72524.1 ABC transporter permease [Mesorhizobium sp. M1C.F.Ca.ET.212.01.1.1]TGR10320.1 ABC transporter permease [Mesorhizobium sp. M1C.F.Ca.ET.204.01.1.1]TGR30923.1 ABC transporter permease [Mesorhizobium sp. M1C.F.Ca.ET.196.01.1.1]
MTQAQLHAHDTGAMVSPRRGEAGTQRRSGHTALGVLKSAGPIVSLVAMVLVFASLTPNFVSAANLQAILESAAVPAVVTIGMTFVLVQGSIDLSGEGVASLANILLSILIANSVTAHDLGAGAIVVALAAGLAVGALNGTLYAYLRMPSLIVTLAMWLITLGLAALLFPSRQPQILDGGFVGLALHKHLGLSALVYLAAALALVAFIVERRTKLGRMGFAIGAEEALVRLAGVNVNVYKVGAFAICGCLTGLAGILTAAQIGVGNPLAGEGLLFPGIAACVIGGTLLSGGRGGVLHSLVGVLVLVTLRNGLVQTGANPLLQKAIEGVVIVVAVAASTWHLRRKTRVVK